MSHIALPGRRISMPTGQHCSKRGSASLDEMHGELVASNESHRGHSTRWILHRKPSNTAVPRRRIARKGGACASRPVKCAHIACRAEHPTKGCPCLSSQRLVFHSSSEQFPWRLSLAIAGCSGKKWTCPSALQPQASHLAVRFFLVPVPPTSCRTYAKQTILLTHPVAYHF
ncbi:hypothetical protein BS50DRAFT_324230 [Corynespora cassiicola Philippines]|uniref:Uncharacterized protein n=1 Tax=Corynespora cassiicola Philippines TaxID=1448308 RepID=A0A2T2NTP5_CORCC|nr:hypothetical protein BS50DRAFT_324230 [Corynespora cassiicola Philippines]